MLTFRNRVTAPTSSEGTKIQSFFDLVSSFDFTTDRLSRHEPTLQAVFTQTPEDQAQLKRLRAMERLFRLVPLYEPIQKLADAGYSSAHDIVQKGRDRFVMEMALDLGGATTAQAMYKKAEWQCSAASVLFGKYAAKANTVQMPAFPDLISEYVPAAGDPANAVPDWTALFGTAGGCACKHCASVLSSAAYLTDTLQWLDAFPASLQGPSGTAFTALDVLVGATRNGETVQGRREDLKRLELTCKAAHTPLPYIDLTNEILEVAVANDANPGPAPAVTVKTTHEPEELLAGPEILYEDAHLTAWSALADSIYPLALPVDPWAEEANAYLRYLGTSRAEIIAQLHPSALAQPLPPESAAAYHQFEDALVKARLGLRARGHNALRGLDAQDNALSGPDAWSGLTESELAPVPVFLRESGLTFEELEELLATRYVNGASDPAGAAGLAELQLAATDACDVTTMSLSGLTASHLARLHRFLRLRLRTGLSITDLDRVLATFSDDPDTIEIDAPMLRRVTRTLALAERLQVPVPSVLTFHAPLDTFERHAPNSPYRRLFLDRSVDSPDAAIFESLRIGDSIDPSNTLGAHRLSVQQALGITASDLDLLTSAAVLQERLFLPALPQTPGDPLGQLVANADDLLSVDALSRLHAAVTLARALKLSIAEFLVLRALASDSEKPFSPASDTEDAHARTERFCDLAAEHKKGTLRAPDLLHILFAFAPDATGLSPSAAATESLRADLSASVDLLLAETGTSEDIDGARTAALLKTLLGDTGGIVARLRDGTTTEEDITALAPFFPGNAQALTDRLVKPSSDPDATPALASAVARFSFVAVWLERHLRTERLILEKVAAAYDLPLPTARHLLAEVLTSPAAASRKAIDDFLPARREDTFGDPAENHAAEWQSETLHLLERHARLLRALEIAPPSPEGPDGAPPESLGELAWVYGAIGDSAPLRDLIPTLAEHPTTDSLADARVQFSEIVRLRRRVALRKRIAGDTFGRIFTDTPSVPQEAVDFLAERTGWDRTTLSELVLQWSYTTGADLIADASLLRIERAIALCRKLGLAYSDARQLLDLDAPFPENVEGTLPSGTNAGQLARMARRAAKARATAAEWPEVARAVRDPFREKLRDSLVAYLVPRKYPSVSALYADLLIDPEVCPCQLTSRVVQATNSVQVFVQRSLLNLDPEVKLPAAAAKEWEVRKAYRLWEANRKVFLYPENWIEPALRDDKTHLFRELETRLTRGELTDDTVEEALSRYLQGLGQLAHLAPMAVCDENDEDGDLVATHVVARTRARPHQWFYRRRTPNAGWLNWEPMSLDIESDGLLLTIHNRRPHLFWPVTTVRPEENQSIPEANSKETARATQRLNVQIAYSTYASGAWSPRKLGSSAPLSIGPAATEGDSASPEPGAAASFDLGARPEHVFLEVAPGVTPTEGQIALAVVVQRPSLQGAVPPTLWPRAVAGRFFLDPAGGKSTVETVTANLGAGVTPTAVQKYRPALPAGSTLNATGIYETDPGGPIAVPRPLPGSYVSQSLQVLPDHPGKYRLVAPSSSGGTLLSFDRFFVEDDRRSFFVRVDRKLDTEWHRTNTAPIGAPVGGMVTLKGALGLTGETLEWSGAIRLLVPTQHAEDTAHIERFDHPYVADFARRLAARGTAGFYDWHDPATGTLDKANSLQFRRQNASAEYGGTFIEDRVDFQHGGAFSTYNWELFFHVPLFIATRLSAEGRHDAAQRWMHFVFDPTGGGSSPAPKRFWRFKPFYDNHDLASIQKELEALALDSSTAAEIQALIGSDPVAESTVASLTEQIATLASDPFNPHAIARHRILAYQKQVVMRYIDNLLDWGDALFRRDTLESNHEALSLYLLAADLLGPRPVTIAHNTEPEGMTFEELRAAGLDAFGNVATALEVITPPEAPYGWEKTFGQLLLPDARLYFCVPQNDMLLGCWDRVADRLFKLRNCMNIDGIVRKLPLFSPPIDPALLVKAAAAGVSFDKVLDSLAAPAPLFRFLRLHSKAVEMASQVAGLGQSLLSALEKRDGEGLTRLRQTHERAILDAERAIRKDAVREAQATLDGLERQKAVVVRREEYYTNIEHRIAQEKQAETNARLALWERDAASNLELAAQVAAQIPQFATGSAGAGGSPLASAEVGGAAIALAYGAVARKMRDKADALVTDAGLLSTEASYRRRSDDWRLQAQLATLEKKQLEKQIAAQQIRLAMAERELDNLDQRRDQSREIEDFLRTKFTATELYDWMVTELAAEHYRAYQVAYDMAKKAERAYQLERGDDAATFVRFGAWDSLKKGLLAGERLLADLRALDAAYLSRTDRERELTRHIPISELAHSEPNAPYLVALRDEGQVEVELPEWLFDADYPGHYFRRLKAVSISVATVRNATDGVQCDLTLMGSRYRKTPQLKNGEYKELVDGTEDRFQKDPRAIKALSTSTADDDAGLFQLDLRDEKLLPYEGQGVIGTWKIEVPREQNRFALHRISDVVLHLRYTARDAGEPFKTAALDHAKSPASGPPARRTRVVSARAESPEAWARFL
ncbi:MAG: neuraminidase-like domain-containing protein, partial [Polyangiaceae bacterium]